MNEILEHKMVPIVNENDAVSGNKGYTAEDIFSDNDALASIVAGELDAEVLILLTDVAGLYDRPPSDPGAKIIDTYNTASDESQAVKFGEKSARGRGGMDAKVNSALAGLEKGAQAVVIASGHLEDVVLKVMHGQEVSQSGRREGGREEVVSRSSGRGMHSWISIADIHLAPCAK